MHEWYVNIRTSLGSKSGRITADLHWTTDETTETTMWHIKQCVTATRFNWGYPGSMTWTEYNWRRIRVETVKTTQQSAKQTNRQQTTQSGWGKRLDDNTSRCSTMITLLNNVQMTNDSTEKTGSTTICVQLPATVPGEVQQCYCCWYHLKLTYTVFYFISLVGIAAWLGLAQLVCWTYSRCCIWLAMSLQLKPSVRAVCIIWSL